MYNLKSDYAQNRDNLAAIVYQTNSDSILLKRESFDLEEELHLWKYFSDVNYHQREKQGCPTSDYKLLFGQIPESFHVLLSEELTALLQALER